MALKNTIKLRGGWSPTDAYVKIGDILLQQLTDELFINFIAYESKDYRDSNPSDYDSSITNLKVDKNSDLYINDIKPLVDQLKSKCYEYAKANGYENFSDV